MLNTNPLWRYLLVAGVFLLAIVYAIPNLYPEDPALNISASRGGVVTEQSCDQLQQHFIASGIAAKSIMLQNGQLLVRFNNTEQQLQAREIARQLLGANYITALSLAPATPAWLQSLGIVPRDLRSTPAGLEQLHQALGSSRGRNFVGSTA